MISKMVKLLLLHLSEFFKTISITHIHIHQNQNLVYSLIKSYIWILKRNATLNFFVNFWIKPMFLSIYTIFISSTNDSHNWSLICISPLLVFAFAFSRYIYTIFLKYILIWKLPYSCWTISHQDKILSPTYMTLHQITSIINCISY